MELNQFEDKIQMCLAQLIWLDVYEAEENIESIRPECERKEADLAEAKEALAIAEAEAAEAGNVDELKLKLDEIQGEQGAVASEVNTKKKVVKDKIAELESVKRDMRTLKGSKAEHSARLENQRTEVRKTYNTLLLMTCN